MIYLDPERRIRAARLSSRDGAAGAGPERKRQWQ
jgi:hypothetical protein